MTEPIDELRSRWEADPSPQRSLQLAEEYRRLDRRYDAVEVLSRLLDDHPEHVASRVALGRFRLELGELEEARRVLEQVVNEDPTHLVAGKLLIELYLQVGDKRQARDRLDLYRLLNESDPEVDILEQRLAGDSDRIEFTPLVEERTVRVDIPRNGDPFGILISELDSQAYWEALAEADIFPVFGAGIAAAGSAAQARLEPSASEVEEAPIPGTTVALANLYLQQGHFDDAETAFQEVLERQPENLEAQTGLDEIERLRAQSVVADEVPDAQSSAAGGDVNARKIDVLRDYLRRLLAAANRN